jgi:hypothetical protein
LQLALHAELSAFKALGDHPAGRAAAADQDARFSKLDGYWSVIAARPKFEKRTEASDNATSRDSLESRPELPDIVEAVRARPETVSFTDWQQTYLFYVRGRQTDGIPRPDIWFRPGLPHGTTFDAARRLPYGQGAEHIEELHGMAPYSRAIATQSAARQFGLNVKPRELQGVLGPLVEYDLAAARAVLAAAVASELDVDVWHDRLCEMDADSCSQAGFYFAARWRRRGIPSVWRTT